MHLRQPEFTYSVFGPFTKHKEKTQKFKEKEDSRCIYQNELDKACFQHDIASGDFNNLLRTIITYHQLTVDGYQREITSMDHKFFNKKSVLLADKSFSGGAIENKIVSNQELPEELHKPVI